MGACNIEVYREDVVLTLGGSISILCYAAVFYLYYCLDIPNLRRHPTTIMIRKCCFELLFVSQYLWLMFMPKTFFWREYYDDAADDDGDDPRCEANPRIWPLCFLTQFSLLGGELWFAVLSMDIHISLTNPFASYRHWDRFYTVLVLFCATSTATVLVSLRPIQYGLSADPMVWVKDRRLQTNWTKILLFYLCLAVIYVYCVLVAVWARWQIHRGLDETLKMRKYSVSKQTSYVIGYVLFWTCVFLLQFLIYLKANFGANINGEAEIVFRTISAFLIASRGLWALGIFLIANRADFSLYLRKNKGINLPPSLSVSEEDQVQLNVALQKEIVRFTALGIQKSVREMGVIFDHAANSRSNSISSYFFGTKLPGDAISFVVEDVDMSSRVTSTEQSSQNPIHRERSGSEKRETLVEMPSISSDADNTEGDKERGQMPMMSPRSSYSSQNEIVADLMAASAQTEPLPHNDARIPSIDQIQITMTPQQPSQTHTVLRSRSSMRLSFSQAARSSLLPILSRSSKFLASIMRRSSSFLFTDYSPKRFAHIRALSGISTESYLKSFSHTTMPEFSEGKSGAFLYFSSDYQYIVKTTTAREFEKLLQILPRYEAYLEKEHRLRRTPLLTRYLGAHRIVMYDIPLYFVVMKNVCPSVDEKYDLKGSWINRHGSKLSKDPRSQRPKKNRAVLEQEQPFADHRMSSVNEFSSSGESGKRKETNKIMEKDKEEKEKTPLFLDNDVKNSFILHPEDARSIAKQIHRDIRFLEEFNLMDYSLLIGVRRKTYILECLPETRRNSVSLSRRDMLINSSTQSRHEFFPTDNATYTPVALRPPSMFRQPSSAGNALSAEDIVRVVQGVDSLSQDQSPPSFAPNGVSVNCHSAAVEGAGTLYFGIIDILQEWNWDKWYERMFKIIFLRKDGSGLSAIEPRQYRERFMQRAVVDIFATLDEVPSDDEDDMSSLEREASLSVRASRSLSPSPVLPSSNSPHADQRISFSPDVV